MSSSESPCVIDWMMGRLGRTDSHPTPSDPLQPVCAMTAIELTTTPLLEASSEPPVTIIRPCRGWQALDLGELWNHRELIYFLTLRDVKVRYKQTVLGAAWAILQPLM